MSDTEYSWPEVVAARLRETPCRYGFETEDASKIRRQNEREDGAAVIDKLLVENAALKAERDEAQMRLASIVGMRDLERTEQALVSVYERLGELHNSITEDIDALAAFLLRVRDGDDPWADPDHAKDWSRALTALVAERDDAIKQRDGYLEGNRQALRALEEANGSAARYKAELSKKIEELAAAKDELAASTAESIDLFKQLVAMRQQRDEARREVCELRYTPSEDNNNIWYAGTRGWDCYEKEGGGA